MLKKLSLLRNILLILALVFSISLTACSTENEAGDKSDGIVDTDTGTDARPVIGMLKISGSRNIELELGKSLKLIIDHDSEVLKYVEWSVDGDSVTVDQSGEITAVKLGASKVIATYGALSDKITVTVVEPTEAPHEHSFVDGKCSCGETDPSYKPSDPEIPHEHSFVDGKCSCGETDPSFKPDTPPSGDDITEKKGYYVSATNGLGKIYLDGTVSEGRFGATTDKSKAVLIYIESSRDGLVLYFEKDGTKNYVVMDDVSTGASYTTDKNNASAFVWNSEKQTFAVANEANNRGFGTNPTASYQNFSTYDLTGSYAWGAFTSADGTTPPDNGDVTNSPSGDDSGSGSGSSGGTGIGSTDTSGVVIGGETIPEYSGNGYYVVNGNKPFFTDADKKMTGYSYSPLDSLGRATGAFSRLTTSLMPTDGRESISHIKPTGWIQATYSSIGLDHLYDRSHLLAHSLMSDDVHPENFVTGTVYLNQQNMTMFEDMVRDLVKAGSDVLYRVTPYYVGDNLLCTGLLLEAYSIEDGGEDVCFCVFLYNVQPGVEIEHATGKSRVASSGSDSGSGGGTTDPDDSANGSVIFTFGSNGAAGHADGSSIGTSTTFTEGGYTLTVTDAYRVYSGAKDETGISCLKMGITSEEGKMTFSVGADVTKVYIRVAGYKKYTGKLTVNGTTHSISTLSNQGEYTVIEVDTSMTKSVTLSTANGGYRVMIDSIELVVAK